YDPAYLRFAGLVDQDTRLVRVTTLESPFRPYLRHYRLLPPVQPAADVLARLRAEATAAAATAIDSADDLELLVYRNVLLDTLVHELNAVRGLPGEPDVLEYAELSEQAVIPRAASRARRSRGGTSTSQVRTAASAGSSKHSVHASTQEPVPSHPAGT